MLKFMTTMIIDMHSIEEDRTLCRGNFMHGPSHDELLHESN